MVSFILRRLGLAIPTLIAVSFLVFVAARMAPSDPIEIMLGEKATPQAVARLKHEYGMDRPFLVQYVDYVWGIATRGDFGRSFSRGQEPVSRMMLRDFPVTAQLAISAFAFALLLGLPAGVLAALYHNSWFDRAAMSVVVALVSVPSIVLGPLLVYAFAVHFRVLPVSGWDSPIYTILPTITLGARSAALFARFMRSSLLDVLRQEYIRTAMAKGLSRGRTVWRHGLKNAFMPVLTVLGTNFGALLTGSFVVETIFQVPGIGFESINSITRRDYPVVQGMALLVAVIYIGVNLLVDVLYGVLDPRVRVEA
ncbi:MAG: ABC transporter permease [Armatimonadetes bacterium]|nr:ABC transporter permease [Armatimonadota bacterium]MDE2207993.1 ABC transporter permease [Armatimonadota bacterium]